MKECSCNTFYFFLAMRRNQRTRRQMTNRVIPLGMWRKYYATLLHAMSHVKEAIYDRAKKA